MNILIVDDHPMVQEVLHAVASEVFDQPSIRTAKSIAEAIEKARGSGAPDLVLLDLGLPDCEGIDALKRFRRAHSQPRVVVFSEADDQACMLAAMQAGAAGFLMKTLTRPLIFAALRPVPAGRNYLSPPAIAPRPVLPPVRGPKRGP